MLIEKPPTPALPLLVLLPVPELTGNAPLFTPTRRTNALATTTDSVTAIESVDLAGGMTFRQAGLYILELIDQGKGRFVSLPFPSGGTLNVVGLSFAKPRVAFLVAVREALELWDCPDEILAAKPPPSVECVATRAPPVMTTSMPIITRDLTTLDTVVVRPAPASCATDAWEVSLGGWTWLVQRSDAWSWVRPAHGLAGCVDGRAITYRAGRIDEFTLDWVVAERRTLKLP